MTIQTALTEEVMVKEEGWHEPAVSPTRSSGKKILEKENDHGIK
jgi:hypothetical protein